MTTTSAIFEQHLIDPEICIRCNTCEDICPQDAITHDSNNYVVEADLCNFCMACVSPCPTGAIDNWIAALKDKPHSIEEQFTWEFLPEAIRTEDVASTPTITESTETTPTASAIENELDNTPHTAPSSTMPPWSAAHPYTNLYNHKNTCEAVVVGNYRVTGEDTESDIRHIILDFGDTPFPVLEGQSIAIFPPGEDANGRPYFARQYSIASPRNGERPNYNNLSLTVKRVVGGVDGNPVDGVCSNYLCDLQKNDKVRVIGPLGSTFLMPNHEESNLLMICTGTGSAPMRAMTEHRRRLLKEQKNMGKNMLFFGARTRRELPYFGPLMKLPADFIDINMAFSREADQPKRYVQDLIRERADDVIELLNDSNSYIYVCGVKGMEQGVLDAFESICARENISWPTLHEQLRTQGRIHFETY